jgi:DNA-binding LacI/PurR family transcriptional regulator
VPRVTLQTIADRVGVSRMTVSNAFSRPDQLSGELRRRILAVADTLGYVGPDPAARALARGTSGAVGVLLTDSLQYAFTDELATTFLGAVVGELAPTGLALTLLTTTEHDDVVPARDVAMDGALVYSCHSDSAAKDWLRRRKLPLVFVDQDPAKGITTINVDDRGGARAAAQHLVDLGHRRVAIVSISPGHPQRERMAGWLDALDAAGIEPVVTHVELNDEDEAFDLAEPLLGPADRPTAVLCFSDVIAAGVVRAARHQGLAVPEDLSVVGFDDSPVARRLDLTTVHQDAAEKGRLAAAALAAAIEHGRAGTNPRVRHQTLPTELVVRGSTASPARSDSRRGALRSSHRPR